MPNSAHEFFGVHVPFLAWLDVKGIEWGAGIARLQLALRPELHNSLGAAHAYANYIKCITRPRPKVITGGQSGLG